MKLGILDWGIGGVGLLKKIRGKSSIDIIYFSDTGFTPYGKVEEIELKKRISDVIHYLKEERCTLIAVACNAGSTVIPDDKNVFGVIHPAIEKVMEMKLDKMGIVGGKRTIESEIYKTILENNGIKVKQRIAQPLSARIEKGDLHSDGMKKEIAEIFGPMKDEEYILLACTHYPVIAEQINDFLPNAVLIDPIEKMAGTILAKINVIEGNKSIRWMTSGNTEEMKEVLMKVYGIETKIIERKTL